MPGESFTSSEHGDQGGGILDEVEERIHDAQNTGQDYVHAAGEGVKDAGRQAVSKAVVGGVGILFVAWLGWKVWRSL